MREEQHFLYIESTFTPNGVETGAKIDGTNTRNITLFGNLRTIRIPHVIVPMVPIFPKSVVLRVKLALFLFSLLWRCPSTGYRNLPKQKSIEDDSLFSHRRRDEMSAFGGREPQIM